MSVISELLESAMKASRKGLLAFHASPYEFGEFSNKFLKKGEGAMVRGAGVYTGTSLEGEVAPRYLSGRNTFIGPDPQKPDISIVQPKLSGYAVPEDGRRVLHQNLKLDDTIAANDAYDLLYRGIRRSGARKYDEMFRSPADLTSIPRPASWVDENMRELASSDDAYEEALHLLDSSVRNNPTEYVYDEFDNWLSEPTDLTPTIRNLLEGRRVRYNPGRAYALDLQVNPERMLDWDKALWNQTGFINDALQRTNDPYIRAALIPSKDNLAEVGVPKEISNLRLAQSGGELINNLERLFEMEKTGKRTKISDVGAIKPASLASQTKARDALMRLGAEFTKYTPLGGGEGTKRGVHYIVYDPKKIQILKMLSLAGVTWAADELRRMGMDNQLTEDTDVTSA